MLCAACGAIVRGGKRKLTTSAEESVDSVAVNSAKDEIVKPGEAKRPKRQAAATQQDKTKVSVVLQ